MNPQLCVYVNTCINGLTVDFRVFNFEKCLAIKFVFDSFSKLKRGEIFIPKMSSILISDLIKILNPKAKIKIIGIRPGEKIHETLCSKDESNYLYENKPSI